MVVNCLTWPAFEGEGFVLASNDGQCLISSYWHLYLIYLAASIESIAPLVGTSGMVESAGYKVLDENELN